MAEKMTDIGGRLHDTSGNHIVAGANEIFDDDLGKRQSEINAEQATVNQNQGTINQNQQVVNGNVAEAIENLEEEVADRYTKEETNNIISRTPETDTIVIDVPSESQSDIAGWLDANTPSGIDPETGRSVRANKLYRVPGPDNTTFSEWAWDGAAYICLADKDYGIDNVPVADSDNCAKSGGIYSVDRELFTKINSVGNAYFIDYNHMVDSNDAQSVPPHYTANADFDAVWVSIFNGSTKLTISGVTVTRIRYFSSFDTEEFATTELGRNTTGVIPAGAVLAIIMLRHSDNAQGYGNLSVTQDNYIINKNELDDRSKMSSRGIFIDYNHYYNVNTDEWISSDYIDSLLIPISLDAKKVVIENATPKRFRQFSAPIYDSEHYVGTNDTGDIIEGAKFLAVAMQHSENPDGYDNVVVRWELSGSSDYMFSARGIYIDYNHIWNMDQAHGIYEYIPHSSWDTAWIPIPTGATMMTCYNVTGKYRFFDAPVWNEENFIKGNTTGEIPQGATFCLFIMAHTDNTDGYDNMFVDFKLRYDELLEDVKVSEPLTPDEITENSFIHTDGVRSSERYNIYTYNLEQGKTYAFSGYYPIRVDIYMVVYCDGNGDVISLDYKGSMVKDTSYTDEPLDLPEGCEIIKLNVRKSSQSLFNLKEAEVEYYNIGELKDQVDAVSFAQTNRLMKVIKNGTNISVRTRLSGLNDILILMVQTQNNMTFSKFYVGPNTLTDTELATSTYLINNTPDMVGAIGVSTFWFLYAQHGWTIPRMNASGHQLDNSDIGSIWKDQNNRRFIIGNISGNYIYLLPELTIDPETGIYSASWNGDRAYPNTLIHVSGGTHTETISASSSRYDLLIQTSQDRRFVADGVDITKDGVYYCDEFVIKEHVLGHNIGKVQVWFPNPVYNGSLIDWDRSFIFKGSSVTCNQVINTQYPFVLTNYRGCIPQMPLQVGDYHSYTLIPKVKKQVNGHRVDLPFNSDDGSLSPNYVNVTRNASELYDVDNQPERCITYLKDDSENYLVGMAGGCSLLRGITEKQNRNIYTPLNEVTCTYGGSSTPNKFYPRTMYGAAFDDNIMTNAFIKEFCCYFCWFDPAENPGQQVYWYKDDDGYIVYAHCQSSKEKAAIRLPDFMEGMVIEDVIEKTDGTTLLTEQVISGCVYVTYDTTGDSANYIVLKVK